MQSFATVREGRMSDVEDIFHIEKECFAKPWSQSFIDRVLHQKRIRCLVAEVGSSMVGFLIYEVGEGYLEVIDIATARFARRRGVALELFGHLAGMLTEEVGEIYVECKDTNKEAISFFESIGMRRTGGVLLRSFAFVFNKDVASGKK